MKPETLLYDLSEFGENYTKLSRSEQEQYILDLINDLLSTKCIKDVLLEARNIIYQSRISRSECPLCSTELQFVTLSSDRLEAWGKPIEMETTRIAYCPNCDWQS